MMSILVVISVAKSRDVRVTIINPNPQPISTISERLRIDDSKYRNVIYVSMTIPICRREEIKKFTVID